MSSDALPLDTQIFAAQIWVNFTYTSISVFALWTLDYIYTFPQEVAAIWSRRLTGNSVLLILSRYCCCLYLVAHGFLLIPGSLSQAKCSLWYYIEIILWYISAFATCCIFALRVVSIYNRSQLIWSASSVLVISWLVATIYMNSFNRIVSMEGITSPFVSRCEVTISPENVDPSLIATTVAVGMEVVLVLILIGLMLKRTIRHVTEMRALGQYSITEIFLRDGLGVCFAVLVIASIDLVTTILALLRSESRTFTIVGAMEEYNSVIPIILINRLVFDLLTFDYNVENGGNTKYQPSRLVFARNPSAGGLEVPAGIDRPDHGEHETVRYDAIPGEGEEIDGGEVVEVARNTQIDLA